MSVSRGATLAALAVAGSAWAGLAALVGLWAMTDGAARWPKGSHICVLGGAIFVAMGEFLFASLVADRLFPRAHPWIGIGVLLISGGVFVGGVIVVGLAAVLMKLSGG